MSKLLANIAAISLAVWGLGFFFYNLGPELHLLFGIAMAMLIGKVLIQK